MSELYVKCPRCRGNRLVTAIVEMSNGFTQTRYGEFSCPLCGGTGEAHREDAAEYVAEQRAEAD